MKQVTDYYFDLQNIVDIDDCSDNYNDNSLIIFKQIIKSILKDNNDYDIAILDNDRELFKMTGGEGVSTFPYKQFEEILNFLFQHSKYIQEKKDELYNNLFHVEEKNDSNIPSENVVIPPVVDNSVDPSSVADPSVADPSVADTSVSDPSVADPSVADPSVADPSVVPPSVPDTSVVPPSVPDTSVVPPSVVDNNSTNPDIINQPPSNQIGGYNIIQKQLFKKINNIITVKLTLYNNNNFKNSFIKKIRYSQ